jgi:hypothetical protein
MTFTELDWLLCNRRRVLFAGGAAIGFAGMARSEEAESRALTFDALYKSFGVLGFEFTDRVKSLNGTSVTLAGYMAPPLKAESAFFVLTRQPLAICPFCQSDADWPVDIVVVLLRAATPLVSAGRRVMVRGTLEIGSATDRETGFVSQIRITNADVTRY